MHEKNVNAFLKLIWRLLVHATASITPNTCGHAFAGTGDRTAVAMEIALP